MMGVRIHAGSERIVPSVTGMDTLVKATLLVLVITL